MLSVEIVHWNPQLRLIPTRIGLRFPLYRGYVNNFGDLLGPMLVEELKRRRGLHEPPQNKRLLAVGSILQFAQDGDKVWGSGALGPIAHRIGHVEKLDVRAVRGPKSRQLLLDLGHQVPEVYGDPALLLGQLWTRNDFHSQEHERSYVVVPNHAEMRHFLRNRDSVVNPRSPLMSVLTRIASAELVVSSSLHGIVVAESFGIPARLIVTPQTKLFKYEDYYNGTGRDLPEFARSVNQALTLGGAEPPKWDPTPLLRAFPQDLWVLSKQNKGM